MLPQIIHLISVLTRLDAE